MNKNDDQEGERITTRPEHLARSSPANLIECCYHPCEIIAINFTQTVDLRLPPYKKRLVQKMANRKQPPKENNQ
ncbi:hypothetical protein MML63_19765 [Kosakonia sacchari]|uniref:hypothetical protein n=1 Tax=Kosakonia sacchari TaxID=1158459 RepID=UPI0025AFFBD0|nr:hypothetical protein [Kosakonia sacchari]MDN2487873.1 hypothetical protein [Kosakonia sacchari]